MSNDWRNHWRKSRWVTIADFPLLSLDINPATYEGGHPDAGCRGNELLKQAFASDDERVGMKLRMRTQPGNPQHKARHLVRMACRPGEYQPDEMDREVFLQDVIAFAVSEGWEVPDWLHGLSAASSRLGANETSSVAFTQPVRVDAEKVLEVECHEERREADNLQSDCDKELADLFDPVRKEQLEAMFPDGGRWAVYAERASRGGLKEAARTGRARFNPYLAAKWWIDTQAPAEWKWERCLRVLANNLPGRSRDSKHLLTDDFD